MIGKTAFIAQEIAPSAILVSFANLIVRVDTDSRVALGICAISVVHDIPMAAISVVKRKENLEFSMKFTFTPQHK